MSILGEYALRQWAKPFLLTRIIIAIYASLYEAFILQEKDWFVLITNHQA